MDTISPSKRVESALSAATLYTPQASAASFPPRLLASHRLSDHGPANFARLCLGPVHAKESLALSGSVPIAGSVRRCERPESTHGGMIGECGPFRGVGHNRND